MNNISPLINDFYHSVGSWGLLSNRFKEAYSLLIQISRASGYNGEREFARGMRIIAIQNTPEATVAIATFILKAKGLDYTVGASYIARMTTPAAVAALDELITKAWNWMSEDAFVQARQFHENYLSLRVLPIKYVILHKFERQPNKYGLVRTLSEDFQKVPFEPGLRIYTRLGGWILRNRDTTLGIDYEFEETMDEIMVFKTEEEATEWANGWGWKVFGGHRRYFP